MVSLFLSCITEDESYSNEEEDHKEEKEDSNCSGKCINSIILPINAIRFRCWFNCQFMMSSIFEFLRQFTFKLA